MGRVYTHQQIDEILQEANAWEEMVGLAGDTLEEALVVLTRELERDGYGEDALLPPSISALRDKIHKTLNRIHKGE